MSHPKQPILPAHLIELIKDRVDVALQHKFRLNLPAENGFVSDPDRASILNTLFIEIAVGMGFDRFAEIPVERLDQFAVTSVLKNHDTRGMLLSLVNSFMIAYSHAETSDDAFQALETLEILREKLAVSRGQSPVVH